MTPWQVFAVAVVALLPGALIFRMPVADRARRAALSAEERVFWSVMLSLVVTSVVALALAAAGGYSLNRLLTINVVFGLLVLVRFRGRLRLETHAPRPGWTAAVPAALIALAWSMNAAVPPAEYVMGGKDPGVYLNEGIQIAQQGSLVVTDATVASVPVPFRDLFFPDRGQPTYYSNRFMGFFLMDPAAGSVISQFTHLYPAWIAIAYGVHGLSGARWVLGLWAILGVVSVYFLGNRLAGRAAGAAGAALLAVHVVEIWFARYPNAEMVMQPLAFAGILAYVRASADGDRFFAPLTGTLAALTIAAHLTGVFLVAAMAAMLLLDRSAGRRLSAKLVVPLIAGTAIAVGYLITFLPPYFAVPLRFVENLWVWQQVLLVLLLGAGVLLWIFANRLVPGGRVQTLVPVAIVAVIWLAAGYAYFVRVAVYPLAQHDADALRTFAAFYMSPYALLAALAGFAILARRPGWTSLPFLVAMTAFSLFFFYKIRIIPEHFWAARRLVALILPGSLLLVGAAAFAPLPFGPAVSGAGRALRAARYVAGSVLVLALGYHYVGASAPIRRHVEYAGLIPRLEQLAASFGDDDLVLVEARAASDVHVLGLPLAYIYARHVLVLWEAAPDKQVFREFLAWASTRYRRVFFLGGGGTELLSRTMAVSAIRGERFQIPEYQSVWNTYPSTVTFKEFDFGIYQFLPAAAAAGPFDLDVGVADDLYVRRFHAKETHPSGLTFRWTRDVSYVSLVGMVPDCKAVSITMGSGGRPPGAGPADVQVFLGARPLGAERVAGGMQSYTFAIPPDVAAAMAQSDDAAQLRIEVRAWSPRQLAGANDDRDLGVMVDRVTACGASAGIPQAVPGGASSSR